MYILSIEWNLPKTTKPPQSLSRCDNLLFFFYAHYFRDGLAGSGRDSEMKKMHVMGRGVHKADELRAQQHAGLTCYKKKNTVKEKKKKKGITATGVAAVILFMSSPKRLGHKDYTVCRACWNHLGAPKWVRIWHTGLSLQAVTHIREALIKLQLNEQTSSNT